MPSKQAHKDGDKPKLVPRSVWFDLINDDILKNLPLETQAQQTLRKKLLPLLRAYLLATASASADGTEPVANHLKESKQNPGSDRKRPIADLADNDNSDIIIKRRRISPPDADIDTKRLHSTPLRRRGGGLRYSTQRGSCNHDLKPGSVPTSRSSTPPQSDPPQYWLPLVPIDEHDPTKEYYVSGGVAPGDEPRPRKLDDDNFICAADHTNQFMPFKVVRLKELMRPGLHLPIHSLKFLADALTPEFVTTYRGIRLARRRFMNALQQAHDAGSVEQFDWEAEYVRSLIYTGGDLLRPGRQVIYPEDIVPFVPGKDFAREAEGLRATPTLLAREKEYWNDLKAEGQIWHGIKPVVHFDASGKPIIPEEEENEGDEEVLPPSKQSSKRRRAKPKPSGMVPSKRSNASTQTDWHGKLPMPPETKVPDGKYSNMSGRSIIAPDDEEYWGDFS